MALVINDRVKETSTTEGTITFNLAGATTGFQTFVAGVGDTNTTYYAIFLQGSAEWEVGLGTVGDATPDTLARTTVITSSTGSKVDFSAGTKDVFCTLPASKTVFGKQEGTNFGNSLLVGHSTTGTLSTATSNTGVGIAALDALTSGDRNTALGYAAGSAIAGSTDNTVIGNSSGTRISSGSHNSYFGQQISFYNTTGGYNTGVGSNTFFGASGQSHSYNSALGYSAMFGLTTGGYNIALGQWSGDNITSGSGNVVIGKADVSSATGDDQLSISDGEDGAVVWITGESTGNTEIAVNWNPSLSTTGKALVMGF